MISYVSGDLFQSPAQTIVNTVNTVGVMGKGIALTFKKAYPEMFQRYRELCEKGELEVGSLFLYRTPHKYVLNFPTKKHWRQPSKPEYVEAGLRAFVHNYEKMKIRSVAFPPLGCGNGELDFESTVRPMMDRWLQSVSIPVYIYAPHPRTEPAEHRTPKAIAAWLRQSPVDLPFDEVWVDLAARFAERLPLTTLASGSPYEVQFFPDEEGFRIWTGSKTEFADREELFDLWTELRAHGFLTASALPTNRRRLASYTFPILAELAYVRVVGLGPSYDSYRYNLSKGLQLVPPTIDAAEQTTQHELSLV